MKMNRNRNQLLMILLATGFFIGAIYTNIVNVESEIFNITVLRNVKNFEIDYKKYLYFIVKERLGTLLAIMFFGHVQWKQVYAGLLSVVVGIVLGSALALSMNAMQLKGVFLCIIGMMPYMFFYGLAFWILITHWINYKTGNWRVSKTTGVILFMSAGILCEVYISPSLLKIFL